MQDARCKIQNENAKTAKTAKTAKNSKHFQLPLLLLLYNK